ncbi:MAG: hypothetical protein K0V04_05905 [Deltaproteobacteria bacterium]|nr:hypothetical protein [Deltaproteobacteria bacterium]
MSAMSHAKPTTKTSPGRSGLWVAAEVVALMCGLVLGVSLIGDGQGSAGDRSQDSAQCVSARADAVACR